MMVEMSLYFISSVQYWESNLEELFAVRVTVETPSTNLVLQKISQLSLLPLDQKHPPGCTLLMKITFVHKFRILHCHVEETVTIPVDDIGIVEEPFLQADLRQTSLVSMTATATRVIHSIGMPVIEGRL